MKTLIIYDSHLKTLIIHDSHLIPTFRFISDREVAVQPAPEKILFLRVEFLLETDSGYPKDMGVTLFTLATPKNSLRCNTHRSAPLFSALAHSREEASVNSLTYSNIETRMDRPKSVVSVRVIRGVATVHVSRLFVGSGSDMYGIRYLRVFDSVSVS